jgi:AcrR family transcriptional regulator
MARPLSEEKRAAILIAAAEAVAESGIGAPTSRIAALAGVAEGTLFTYFETKDVLLNQLYVELKLEVGVAMVAGYRLGRDLPDRWRRIWDQYIQWGADNVSKRRALSQLEVSDRIGETARYVGAQAAQDVVAELFEGRNIGLLGEQSADFIAGLFVAMAETTLDFIARQPDRRERFKRAGFKALWNLLSNR